MLENACSKDILIKSLILLGLRVPLLDEQAIADPTYIAIVKPSRPAENPFLGKVQSFRERTAGGIFFRAGDLNFLQLILLERMVYHRSTRLGYYAFSLHRVIDPIAQSGRPEKAYYPARRRAAVHGMEPGLAPKRVSSSTRVH